ncbi:TIGR03936 family radical SAM-associated protein [Parablautia sp. Marseille-Q6255]|uniref:TIGR03936 family radical SAM-associated protein n=1 Tax=Parablautia sp. Marseille-Q6255 TaxID=3039593 RepID=UPI0024BC188D|nr:TIGR03936 family radical SAM-associated protein [Parablautia sp. Marseille-Q6255]
MKVRVKFEKYGIMKFIGHLDIMRYFQKAIRRAGIDIAYSEGLSPHMIMSFAAPLGVGITSEAEYMDIELRTPISSAAAIAALNRTGAEGIQVTGFYQIPDGKANKAMTLVAAADYKLRFRRGYEPKGDWQSGISHFYAKDSIPVIKKTKKSEKEIDLRPLIYEMRVHAGTVFMKLSAGSVANVKPELVMDTYLKTLGLEADPFAYEIHRCEIYADTGTEGTRRLVPLCDLGEEIL